MQENHGQFFGGFFFQDHLTFGCQTLMSDSIKSNIGQKIYQLHMCKKEYGTVLLLLEDFRKTNEVW